MTVSVQIFMTLTASIYLASYIFYVCLLKKKKWHHMVIWWITPPPLLCLSFLSVCFLPLFQATALCECVSIMRNRISFRVAVGVYILHIRLHGNKLVHKTRESLLFINVHYYLFVHGSDVLIALPVVDPSLCVYSYWQWSWNTEANELVFFRWTMSCCCFLQSF